MTDGMIRAGQIDEVMETSGQWVFSDIGIAGDNGKTCGFLVGDGVASEVTFAELVKRVCDLATSAASGPALSSCWPQPTSCVS